MAKSQTLDILSGNKYINHFLRFYVNDLRQRTRLCIQVTLSNNKHHIYSATSSVSIENILLLLLRPCLLLLSLRSTVADIPADAFDKAGNITDGKRLVSAGGKILAKERSLYRQNKYECNLLFQAWNLWKDGKQRDFVDTSVLESCSISEVFKCIHIELMCVQDSPNARPPMSFVVSMLENADMPHPMPVQPIYFVQRHYEAEDARGGNMEKSVNNVSLTVLEGR
uniref:S-locus receptor kinase C-terminal domain-containing protein n=1 Tax=Oryza brachyantha TaxID=4533 RepID=J3M1Q7_ORYBR